MKQSPEGRYAELVATFARRYPVQGPAASEAGNRFGSLSLRINEKIFAMLVRGRLVVKLPRSRVDALVASCDGERFVPRRDGKAMREWLVLRPSSEIEWPRIAKEAMDYVSGQM